MTTDANPSPPTRGLKTWPFNWRLIRYDPGHFAIHAVCQVFYLGAVAGVLASLLDAVVVAAATSMAPPAGGAAPLEETFARNLVIGIVFAGLSGVTYYFVQRWSGANRPK